MSFRRLTTLAALVVCACSARRLPAGTPPPEYEPPVVTPWSAGDADAGAIVDGGHTGLENDASVARKAASAPALSLDAGVR
jgi:hypothetical protein